MGKKRWGQASQGGDEVTSLESERTSLCLDYLYACHRPDIEEIISAEDRNIHYPLVIKYCDLYDANPQLGSVLFEQPTKLLQNFDDGARELQERIFQRMKRKSNISIKDNIHVRVAAEGSVLDCPEAHPSISQIRVKDVGRLLTVHGIVIRSGGMKMLDGERVYECTKCKHRFKMCTDLELGSSIDPPSVCPSERADACSGVKFREIDGETRIHDYQEIRIQESMQALSVGTVPRSIAVVLDDDLVDTVQAGGEDVVLGLFRTRSKETDDVVVTGVLFSKWRNPNKDARCDIVLSIRANFIRKTNKLKSSIITTVNDVEFFEQFWSQFRDGPFKGRNLILQGICPQIFGLFTVKLAVALTLIGGVQRLNASGTRVRGESHLLLVGDPGTGKSQFLKYAVKLSHRPVLTTGLGSTSAGLTVTAVKDGGEWVLEAGALVLADGGLCCIDEFDSIREADRATILEAMEQQTISVAKAGLVRALNTRTTVFGVTNPKGQYDPYQSLSVNTTLSAPLLSRFDIVLVLLDTKNPQWDDIVSAHILAEHSKVTSSEENEDLSRFWTLQMLRSYIHYVRSEFEPILTFDAEKVIMCYYQLQRRSAVENAARTTVRMLESLVRLAQAHARLMFRNEVLRPDAVAAVICIESSMTTSAILDNVGNALQSTFAENPDQEYAKQEQIILSALNLEETDTPTTDKGTGSVDAMAGARGCDAGNNSERGGISSVDRLPRYRDGGVSDSGSHEDRILLESRKGDGQPGASPAQEQGAACVSGDALHSRDLPGPSSRHGGEGEGCARPPQQQAKYSMLDILGKLKGRGEGSRDQGMPKNAELKNATERFTEELIQSSSQYSLP